MRMMGPARAEFGVLQTSAYDDARDADQEPFALRAAEHHAIEHGSIGKRQARLGSEGLRAQVENGDRGFSGNVSGQITEAGPAITCGNALDRSTREGTGRRGRR